MSEDVLELLDALEQELQEANSDSSSDAAE